MSAVTSAANDVPRLRHFIAGKWRQSAADRWITDVNPADAADIMAHVPEGTSDDVTLAVSAAADALPSWRALPGPVRA